MPFCSTMPMAEQISLEGGQDQARRSDRLSSGKYKKM
jgi:hypothetical protein